MDGVEETVAHFFSASNMLPMQSTRPEMGRVTSPASPKAVQIDKLPVPLEPTDADALREPAAASGARSLDRLHHDAGDTADSVAHDPLEALGNALAHVLRLLVERVLSLALVLLVERQDRHALPQSADDARCRSAGSVDHVLGQTLRAEVDPLHRFALSSSLKTGLLAVIGEDRLL